MKILACNHYISSILLCRTYYIYACISSIYLLYILHAYLEGVDQGLFYEGLLKRIPRGNACGPAEIIFVPAETAYIFFG